MLTARAAILQALRRGPGYGRQLMRRVHAASGGRVSLGPGSVYPALRALQKARLVRAWTVVAGRTRGGRARTYYELTVTGIRDAEAEATALAAIAAACRPAASASPAERAAMRERVERVAALFDFAMTTRAALAGVGRRG